MTCGMAPHPRFFPLRAKRGLRRLGLLGRFSVLSLASLIVLGAALGVYVGHSIHRRALSKAAEEAGLITRFGITPQISSASLDHGFSPEAVQALDNLLRAGYSSYPVRGIRIYSAAGRMVYSSEPRLIGSRVPRTASFRRALAGRSFATTAPGSKADPGAGHGKVIDAYVPLAYYGPDVPASGVFEVFLDYRTIAAAQRDDVRGVLILLTLGLFLVWAVLFRIVAGASRRLRRQAADNEYQASHDGLTDLLNRAAFDKQVHAALAGARRQGGLAAVMIVDLDRFKEVNDTLGHYSGDLLLQQAADRLRHAVRGGDALARL